MSPLHFFPLLALFSIASAQSNYADQANNIEYQGDGLPPEATLDGKVTKLDDLSPVIFLNRTKAALNCAAGSMLVSISFVCYITNNVFAVKYFKSYSLPTTRARIQRHKKYIQIIKDLDAKR